MKTVYGSVLPGQADDGEMIPIVPVGATPDEAPGQIPRSASPASSGRGSRKS